MGQLPLGSEREEMRGQAEGMAEVAHQRQINRAQSVWDCGCGWWKTKLKKKRDKPGCEASGKRG